MPEIANMQNPFITGQPARGNDFVGRVRLLNHIGRFIDEPDSVNFAVIGKRRSGKTSLLKRVQDTHRSDELLVLYFNMQKYVDSSMDTFLGEVKRRLLRYSVLPASVAINHNFEDFLGATFKYPVRRVLLLFDEFDVLCRNKENEKQGSVILEFAEYWQALTTFIEKKKLPVKNIFASSQDFLHSESPCCYELFKTCAKGTVSTLRQSAVNRILEMGESMEFRNESILDEFYKVTAGNPYFTQVLAHTLFESKDVQAGKPVGRMLLRISTKEALLSFGYGAAVIWGELKPAQKIILYFASRMHRKKILINSHSVMSEFNNSNIYISERELQKSLNSLVKDKYFCEDDNFQYSFCSVFFRSWVQKSVNKSNLKKEFHLLVSSYL